MTGMSGMSGEIEDIRLLPLEGRSVRLTGGNLDKVKQVAGECFTGVYGEYVIITPPGSSPVYMQVGWSVMRFANPVEGEPDIVIVASPRFPGPYSESLGKG